MENVPVRLRAGVACAGMTFDSAMRSGLTVPAIRNKVKLRVEATIEGPLANGYTRAIYVIVPGLGLRVIGWER